MRRQEYTVIVNAWVYDKTFASLREAQSYAKKWNELEPDKIYEVYTDDELKKLWRLL